MVGSQIFLQLGSGHGGGQWSHQAGTNIRLGHLGQPADVGIQRDISVWSHWGRSDGVGVVTRVVVVDVVQRGVGETREMNTTVLRLQQGRHRLSGPHRDQNGVFILSQLRNKVTPSPNLRPSVRFVRLEGLPRLFLYSEPSTHNV